MTDIDFDAAIERAFMVESLLRVCEASGLALAMGNFGHPAVQIGGAIQQTLEHARSLLASNSELLQELQSRGWDRPVDNGDSGENR